MCVKNIHVSEGGGDISGHVSHDRFEVTDLKMKNTRLLAGIHRNNGSDCIIYDTG